MDIVNEDAKRALVDREKELGLIQDCSPLSKLEIQVEIAHKIWAWLSAFGGNFVQWTIVLGRACFLFSGVERLSITRRFQM